MESNIIHFSHKFFVLTWAYQSQEKYIIGKLEQDKDKKIMYHPVTLPFTIAGLPKFPASQETQMKSLIHCAGN